MSLAQCQFVIFYYLYAFQRKPVRLYCLSVYLVNLSVSTVCLSVYLGKPFRLYCLSVCLRPNLSPSCSHLPPCRFGCVSSFVRPSVSVGQSACVSVRLAGYLHIHCLVLVRLSVRPSVRPSAFFSRCVCLLASLTADPPIPPPPHHPLPPNRFSPEK